MTYKRILIAVDGSETSKLALSESMQLAKQLQASLGIVYVVDELPLVYSPGAGLVSFEPSLQEYGEQVLGDAKRICEDNGISPETLLEKISPVGSKKVSEKIIETARSWKANLLVLGTHGRRGFNRIFLGSVAEESARISTIPLLLIRGKENI
jgi:nucleotide-binding universal stress UspA family protein